jgi:hypothetical protein
MRRLLGVCIAVLAACGDKGATTDDGGNGSGSDRDATPLPDSAPEDISIYEAYARAWGEPNETAARGLIEFAAADTLTLYEPTRTLMPRDAVLTAMLEFSTATPGGHIDISGNVRESHDRAWLRWEAFNGASTSLAVGTDLMRLAVDARIERVHSFVGTLPTAVGANTAVQQALIDAWNEPDTSLRNMKLQTALTDNIVVSIESATGVTTGRAALSAVIGNQLNAAPNRLMSVTSGYLEMPSAFMVAWKLADGSTTMGAGVMMALIAGDGRISELVYWDGAQP